MAQRDEPPVDGIYDPRPGILNVMVAAKVLVPPSCSGQFELAILTMIVGTPSIPHKPEVPLK